MRSKLFVPASRPELFDKALASMADALSFDLEDAVALTRKQEARASLAAWLGVPTFVTANAQHPKKIIVRVNAADTPDYAADLAALRGLPIDVLNLPKVESASALRAAIDDSTDAGFAGEFLVTVETPRALADAAQLAAAHPRVAGLQLGLADLFEPLGIERYQPCLLYTSPLASVLAAQPGIRVLGSYPRQ